MITVGITNYNYARYLPRAIESALNQSIHVEVIVADDGSTDGSIDVARDYDVRTVLHRRNSGSAAWGWNELIRAARGEYLFLLSADDELLPHACELVQACAVTRGGDWIFGDLEVIDADSRPIDFWCYAGWPLNKHDALALMARTLTLPVTMIAAFRTAWLRDNHLRAMEFDTTRAFLDTRTGLDWLAHDPQIRRVPAPLVRYRRHAGGETVTAAGERVKMQAELRGLLCASS